MVGDVNAHHEADLGWLLQNLIDLVPYTRSVVLLSADGLATAAYGVGPDPADWLAAIASGMFSLARSAGTRFGGAGGVRQVVVEVDDQLMFVSSAGFGSVLVAVAGHEVDVRVLGYEVAQLVKSVQPFLETSARTGSPRSDA
jgi:predicted regulator of Ras-like GTPase activity (Roadblock/LC7/MglB family)